MGGFVVKKNCNSIVCYVSELRCHRNGHRFKQIFFRGSFPKSHNSVNLDYFDNPSFDNLFNSLYAYVTRHRRIRFEVEYGRIFSELICLAFSTYGDWRGCSQDRILVAEG